MAALWDSLGNKGVASLQTQLIPIDLAVDIVTTDIVSASHPAYREIYRVFSKNWGHLLAKPREKPVSIQFLKRSANFEQGKTGNLHNPQLCVGQWI